jgi:hypothetical protein
MAQQFVRNFVFMVEDLKEVLCDVEQNAIARLLSTIFWFHFTS